METHLHGVLGVRNVEEIALHRAQVAEQHALHVVDNVRFERTVRLRVRDGFANLWFCISKKGRQILR